MKSVYTEDELIEVRSNIKKIVGWDFSSMRVESEAPPWDYVEVTKKYLKASSQVLDIGTGGGEKFMQISKLIKSGTGIDIDPEMIKVANSNVEKSKTKNMHFYTNEDFTRMKNSKFDLVTDRHAPFEVSFVEDHLKSGGYFITQQVGEKNMLNIKEALGIKRSEPVIAKQHFEKSKLKIVAFMEYDIEYIVKDIESLVFWLSALDFLHAGMDGPSVTNDSKQLNKILKGNVSKRGFHTNEQRFLLIASTQ